jgi:hypothetical protein
MATSRRWTSKILLLGAFLAACLLLSGCVTLTDFEAGQDYRADIVAEAQPEQPVKQTFISRRAPGGRA